MTTIERGPVRQAVYGKGWVSPPSENRHQLTHAVDPGFRIALCGVSTAARAGTWPVDATLWDSPLGRCPTCARVVYGSADRRS